MTTKTGNNNSVVSGLFLKACLKTLLPAGHHFDNLDFTSNKQRISICCRFEVSSERQTAENQFALFLNMF